MLWVVVPDTTISNLLQELWPHWGAWSGCGTFWGVFGVFCKRRSFLWGIFISLLCFMYLPLKSHSLDFISFPWTGQEKCFVQNCAHVLADSSAFTCPSYLEPSNFHCYVFYPCLFQFIVLPYVHVPGGGEERSSFIYYPVQKLVQICLRHTHMYSSGDSSVN